MATWLLLFFVALSVIEFNYSVLDAFQVIILIMPTFWFPIANPAISNRLKSRQSIELPERHLSSGTQSPNEAAALMEGFIDHPERAAPSNPGYMVDFKRSNLIMETWPEQKELDLTGRSGAAGSSPKANIYSQAALLTLAPCLLLSIFLYKKWDRLLQG